MNFRAINLWKFRRNWGCTISVSKSVCVSLSKQIQPLHGLRSERSIIREFPNLPRRRRRPSLDGTFSVEYVRIRGRTSVLRI